MPIIAHLRRESRHRHFRPLLRRQRRAPLFTLMLIIYEYRRSVAAAPLIGESDGSAYSRTANDILFHAET